MGLDNNSNLVYNKNIIENLGDIAYKNAFEKFGSENAAKLLQEITVRIAQVQLAPQKHLIHFYITKASFTEKDGMTFSATASDTDIDSYGERMSVTLYENFIKRVDGGEYISLSHYPSLDGKAELGKIIQAYIDGDKLKIKGRFHDTELGRTAWNSIRKDRREQLPQEKRIRISIGFFDYGHTHGNERMWTPEMGKICTYCMLGIKNKQYLDGKLDHAALTRRPALPDTDIEDINEQS